MLKNNNSLISMDLRENEGLSKEYSRYIYKKLLLNMEKYKQQRLVIEKNKELVKSEGKNNQNQGFIESINNNNSSTIKYKSLKDNNIFP